MPKQSFRSQAAIDFLTSYGFAILILAIAIYAILQLGVFNYSASPQYCYSQSPFECSAYSINSMGVMEVVLSQSSGGILTIDGISCSTTSNSTKVGPKYGNVATDANSVYYPISQPSLSGGISLYPGAQNAIYLNCYGNSHAIATGGIGKTFIGYLWVNYTFSSLPKGYQNIARAASISVKYT